MTTDSNGGADRERLRAITEKIQVGDADEGAEALEEMITLARDQGRADTKQAMRDELMEMRVQTDNKAALDKFARKYSALKDDNLLIDAAQRVLRGQIVDDLKGAGVAETDLAPIGDDLGRLVAVHGHARVRGMKLRNPDDLLDATGAVLSEKFNIKPSRRSPEEYVRGLRAERGYTPGAESQPTEAAGRRQGGSRAPSAPSGFRASGQPDRDRNFVQSLRAARGFASRT